MSTKYRFPDELVTWLESKHAELKRLIDSKKRIQPKRMFDEVVNQAHQFIFISKEFLQLAKLANEASKKMVVATPEKVDKSRGKKTRSNGRSK